MQVWNENSIPVSTCFIPEAKYNEMLALEMKYSSELDEENPQ